MRRPNSSSGYFSELPLIPKAQDAMTSMVNLAIVSFTSTVEPDNNPWYCNCQDFHLLIQKVSTNSFYVAFIQTFLAPQIRKCPIIKLVLIPLVCQKGSINIGWFVLFFTDSFLSPYYNTLISIWQCIIYILLHTHIQLFFPLHYLDILHTVYIYHSLDAALINMHFKNALCQVCGFVHNFCVITMYRCCI